MTTTTPYTEVLCSQMSDPTACLKAALEAVDRYNPDTDIETALNDVLNCETFTTRYPYPALPLVYFRESLDDDESLLSALEDEKGEPRGSQVGVTFDWPDGTAELHINRTAAPLIAIHEAAHLLDPFVEGQSHREGHGPQWRSQYRDLLTDLYSDEAGTAFDRAVTATEPCAHGSIPHLSRYVVDR